MEFHIKLEQDFLHQQVQSQGDSLDDASCSGGSYLAQESLKEIIKRALARNKLNPAAHHPVSYLWSQSSWLPGNYFNVFQFRKITNHSFIFDLSVLFVPRCIV